MKRNQRSPGGSRDRVEGAVRGDTEPVLPAQYLTAWSTAWLGVVVIAFINGVLHRTYSGTLGELRAHQVSCVVLLLLLAPWVLRTERRHPLPTVSSAMAVGVGWSMATVAFEFLFGHYVNQDSWAKLLNDYDLRDGRLWLLDVLGITAAPTLARAWLRRRRGSTDKH